jgi:molecular chaperone DnaJ
MTTKRDYYEVLSVERTCDGATLKSAYRRLALQYHPDRNPNDPSASEKFKEASEAYAVLSDGEKRARYDRFGHAGVGGASGPGGFGFDVNNAGFDFADLFGEIFGFAGGGGAGGSRATGGSDLVYRMAVSFRDAAFGVEAPLVISRLEPCETCSSTGAEKGSKPKTCSVCRGSGRQRFSQGFLTIARPCGACRGEGVVIEKPCPDCRGEGRKRGSRKLEIRVPAGVDTGTRLRLAGEGDAGANGGPAGDLYVVLTVEDHESFVREDDDVVLNLELPFPTLVLGGDVSVPTLDDDEPETVTIPAGTRIGSEVRLRGRGFGRLGHRGRGDLVVRASLRVPESPSSEEKALLRQYAEMTGAPVAPKGVLGKAKKIFS